MGISVSMMRLETERVGRILLTAAAVKGVKWLAKKSFIFSLHDRRPVTSSDLCGKATILLGVLPIILPIKRRFTYEKAFTVFTIS